MLSLIHIYCVLVILTDSHLIHNPLPIDESLYLNSGVSSRPVIANFWSGGMSVLGVCRERET